MKGINIGKWLAGGVVAAALVWMIEALSGMLFMDEMKNALESHNLSMEMTTGAFVISIVISLILGLILVFFYAASRPRFGPGPKTAVIVAIALWFGVYLMPLIGYNWIGLYPNPLLIKWGLIGFVELILATLAGAWIYKENEGKGESVSQ